MANIKLQIGLDVIRSYRRLAYTPWYALAEFVDNSTQSYRDNRGALDRVYAKESTTLKVMISYDRDAGILIVKDNAMGMSFEDLDRALYIGKPPTVTAGRSQFGLGLKTAACWFGDKWTVRTKKLGELYGYEVTVDVEEVAVARKSYILPHKKFNATKSDHFTEIRIEDLHTKMQGRGLGKTKESLRSMYRVDIRAGQLAIAWNTVALPWDDKLTFLAKQDGTDARVEIDFTIADRKVNGWVGVLAPGSSSRGNAGFALIRRGRLIRGWPSGWRPEAIFGPSPGRNDLINQRITGEIHLDAFDVTHTKDDILWQENEEDEVQEGIKDCILDLLDIARSFRHPKPSRPPRDRKLSLNAIVEDTDFRECALAMGIAIDSTIAGLVPSDVAEAASTSLARSVNNEPAVLTLDLGGRSRMRVISTSDFGADSPYLTVTEVKKNSWVLVVNAVHSICGAPEDVGALRGHLQHVLADGLIMWALILRFSDCVPETVSPGKPTKGGFYHGINMPGEFCALATTLLRRRMVLGSLVRTGDTPFRVPPESQRRHSAVISGDLNLEVLGEWMDHLARLPSEHHQVFILGCRMYQEALTVIDEKPDFAYLLLVSCVEVFVAKFSRETTEADLTEDIRSALSKCSDEGARKILCDRLLALDRGISRNFVSFIQAHVTEQFWEGSPNISPEKGRIEPAELAGLLKRIYNQRSKTLHEAEPFPPNVLSPPDGEAELDRRSNLTVGERRWTETQMIPYVRFFERLVQHVLVTFLTKRAATSVP